MYSDPSGCWPRWITKGVADVFDWIADVAAVLEPSQTVSRQFRAGSLFCKIAYEVQCVHYDVRKELNVDIPQTEDAAIASGWYGPKTNPKGPAANCHQFTAEDGQNVKYVSPDGKREAIYDSKKQLVTDPRDIGTYNFSPSGSVWGTVGHVFFDMVPWVIFGNDDGDPGPVINWVAGLFN